MSKKVQKRVKKNAAEFEDLRVEAAQQVITQARTNDDLFVIDRKGSKSGRKAVTQEIKPKAQGSFVSAAEKKLVGRLVTAGGKRSRQYESLTADIGSNEARDIWGEPAGPTKKRAAVDSKRTRVALPGQSYNPSQGDHQDALAEALALQIKRDEALLRSSSSSAVLVSRPAQAEESGSEDEDEEDDGEDEEDEDGEGRKTGSRRAGTKFTRAQRNKIRARNIAGFELSKAATEKGLLNSINQLPRMLKLLEQEQQAQQTAKALRKDKMELTASTAGKALTLDDVGAVPLSDELGGGLRTVIPKGVALSERVGAMRKTGDLSLPDRRKRRAYENPHAPQRLVYHAKYKL
ncbi:hypothetical protein B484DRAFT_447929 [Ochromonadaceae sp. CCMP2298]|nr:hypothetical protein B484DRAFT_447929 [Ochromonadaceae sp. CCMP2298]|mmetsp:Transcript_32620/g.71779  ORF Transcript_32620/g.71779 Transcript_32620/m.71779 type:complete len:348 (+) Transcript_32620:88-1131(+)|eukprot:CAMPEP_0173209320 /NCGR_PEP_ID=MMETSP1141-20130122/23031_1 /TAXON_ID=483371 /ORGANISM="non described non described, Strain CCMP2298" /LENGTH=347 /DNA_ID=CAMNT_0014135919 /DNA_START=38 /DNA_END=1081 /DNA_ORIENTATION=-